MHRAICKITAEEAAQKIVSGQRIFITGNCSTPIPFLRGISPALPGTPECGTGAGFEHRECPNTSRRRCPSTSTSTTCLSARTCATPSTAARQILPRCFSTKSPICSGTDLAPDVAVIHVSPPDEHGYCSYGVEVGVTKSAAESAKMVIAQINPHMPRTLGDSFIHISKIDYCIEVDYPLPEVKPLPASAVQDQVAEHIAALIPEGATLQTGIGGIPDAVLRRLTNHRNLGIHTELFSDGVMEMIEAGVITNAAKTIHTGKVIAGFVIGTRALYRYIHDNPVIELHPTEYVNDPVHDRQERPHGVD